jgi:hypothetical protein
MNKLNYTAKGGPMRAVGERSRMTGELDALGWDAANIEIWH